MEEEQASVPMPSSMPVLEQLDPTFARYLLESTQDFTLWEHFLRGEVGVPQPDGTISWEKRYSPIMNEQGIYETIFFLRTLVSKYSVMSWLGEKQALKAERINANSFSKNLFLNHVDFALDLERWDLLDLIICNFIEFTIQRSVGGGERKFMKSDRREVVSTVRSEAIGQEKKGLLGLGKFGL